MSTLTLDRLEAMLKQGLPVPQINPKVIVSSYALKETSERLFPISKNRSKRIHKKLVKRFGGEFRKVPCIYKTPMGLVCHPALYAELKRQIT